MDDQYYPKPLHLILEEERFDRVRGKTSEQVLKEVIERAQKLLEADEPRRERAFQRMKRKWVREELAKIKEKKRKQRLARKAKEQKAKASGSS